MRHHGSSKSTHQSYTIGETMVDLPQSELFSICKDICGKIKDSTVDSVIDYRFQIKGHLEKNLRLDPKFVLIVEKAENGSILQINYNQVGFFKPSTKDFVDPFFKELEKKIPLKAVHTQIKRVLNADFCNLFGKIFD